jgi:hypothetical protein
MNDLPSLPRIALGRYRHYKGGEYQVLGVVRHSESLEPMVLYRPLYNDSGDWVRPLGMFLETVEVDGQRQPRFALVSDAAQVSEEELAATIQRMEARLKSSQSEQVLTLLALHRELAARFERDLGASRRDTLLAKASALMLVQAAAAAEAEPLA